MRVVIAGLAAAVLLSGTARADSMDLSTIKCKDFVESSKDNIGVIAMWLHGYYTGKADGSPVIDFDKFKKDAESLGRYCGEHPDHGLITATDKVLGD